MTDAERRAYEKGQREMRERATQVAMARACDKETCDILSYAESRWLVNSIRFLPILSADKEKP
jgi:hypothetical protein